MAEVERSLAQMLAILADNSTGDITPEDLRDMLLSLDPPHGSAYMEGNAVETVIATVDVYAVIAGVFSEGDDLYEFTVSPTGGRLTFTGASPRHMQLSSNFDIVAAGNNKSISAKWHKNGSPITRAPRVKRFIGTGADQGATAVSGDVVLESGDYVDLRVANHTDSTNMTLEDVRVSAFGFLV